MYAPGQETVTTYRYVRVSIVGVVMLLFVALGLQIAADAGRLLPSISAYFYTPVRSVLVGSLVAAAFLLVAVRGRPGAEDALLNLGGMLVPVVAFIPTPLDGGCAGGGRCIPEQFLPTVTVSMGALLLVGLPAVVLALWVVLVRPKDGTTAPSGYVGALVIWGGFAIWFGPGATWPLRESLLAYGHYVAAVGMFVAMVAVAVLNARRTDREAHVGARTLEYSTIYAAVAAAMAGVLVGAIVAWAVAWSADGALLFWVEAALLLLFSVFWAVQTVEFWTLGLPEEACEAPLPEQLT